MYLDPQNCAHFYKNPLKAACIIFFFRQKPYPADEEVGLVEMPAEHLGRLARHSLYLHAHFVTLPRRVHVLGYTKKI